MSGLPTAAVDASTRLIQITEMTQELVRIPSQGGIDEYGPVVDCMVGWMARAGLDPVVLEQNGGPVAVAATVDGDRPGPHYVLDGCLDTAAVGDPTSWSRPPFSGDVEDGWLHGRGAADSKAALAMATWLLADLAKRRDFAGRLTVLGDLDEHTGGFAGIQRWLDGAGPVDGVIVGYPGVDHIIVGGRGVWRARITVYGQAAHTGSSSRRGISAITRALRLADELASRIQEEATVDPVMGLGPQLTITEIAGGTPGSWSVVPDRCELAVDVRLTTIWRADDAAVLVREACAELDTNTPAGVAPTVVKQVGQPWSAFRLPDEHRIPVALLAGARAAGLEPRLKVAGPSNIACLLADRGVPATAGFGVRQVGLHAADERIDLSTLPAVYAAHRTGLRQLLR